MEDGRYIRSVIDAQKAYCVLFEQYSGIKLELIPFENRVYVRVEGKVIEGSKLLGILHSLRLTDECPDEAADNVCWSSGKIKSEG